MPVRPARRAPTRHGPTSRRLPAPLVLGIAYVAGAIPFAQIVARRTVGVDLRTVGTGTVSGSGLAEVAGIGPMAASSLGDVAKGAVGPALAGADRPVLRALAGAAAVCGHNWSPFLGGAGGRGLSVSCGALAVGNAPGTVTLGLAYVGGKAAHQSSLGCFVGDLLVVPVLARTRGRDGALAGAAVVVPMLIKRVLGNRRPDEPTLRTYLTRLVADQDRWNP